jgi:hypothetical protein
MFEVTEYFIHILSEADWLTTTHVSICAEASKTRRPSCRLLLICDFEYVDKQQVKSECRPLSDAIVDTFESAHNFSSKS